MIHLEPTQEVKAMATMAFPSYKGRKFKLDNSGKKVNLTSHWDGGSRDTFVVLKLDTGQTKAVPQNGTVFDQMTILADTFIAPGFIIVEHSIFMGKDAGITFHINPKNALAFLPEPINLSGTEQLVLKLTASLKSSYNGYNPRIEEARIQGVSQELFTSTQSILRDKGLLNKVGAITIKGRNAIQGVN